MHLPWTWRMTRVIAVVGLLWLGIVIVDAMDDPLTRGSLLMTGE